MRRLLSYLPVITGLVFAALGLQALFAPGRLALSLSVLPSDAAGYGAVRGDLGAFFLGIAVLSFLGMSASRRKLARDLY